MKKLRKFSRRILAIVASISVCHSAAGSEGIERYVQDGVLVSLEEPSLAMRVDEAFEYLGRHPIRIGDVAAGERFVFIDEDSGAGHRFLIVQIEGFLPGVDNYYRYDLSSSPVVVGYPFRSNGFAFDMKQEISANPTKEVASTHKFLRSKGYSAPDLWMMWRSLTVTDEAKKNEIIIFYIEDADSAGLTLADLYQNGSSTRRWIAIQQELEVRANSSFQLAEIDERGQPIASSWSSIPNSFRR